VMSTVVERLLFTVAVAGTFAAGAAAFVSGYRRKVDTLLGGIQIKDVLDSTLPTLIYFWSANCAQCQPQERQIEKARRELSQAGKSFAIRKVDALAETKLAKSLHVMTVPMTVLVSADGRIIAWNPGLARSETIVEQFKDESLSTDSR